MDALALKAKFIKLYGEGEFRAFFAPGRVNLIGEHIDYNGGKVFPAALEMKNIVLARPRKDRIVRMAADDLDIMVEGSLDELDCKRGNDWGAYQFGVCYELLKDGYPLVGCDMLFWGNVPFGSGLSSSASIEVATAVAMATLGLEAAGKPAELDMVQMAIIGQRAENQFVGVNCGIMDQFASAMGKKNHAILLDCNTIEYSHVPMDMEGYSIVIGNTNKKRGLADSKYNERRAECDEGLADIKTVLPELSSLCAMTPEIYEKVKLNIKRDIVRNRVEHAVYENARVIDSVELLKKGDIVGFGRLLNASHKSLKRLYEVTGTELDAMAETAMATDGCIGARMTGAGFGGCTVSIVANDKIDSFIKTVGEKYEALTGLKPAFYVSGAGAGAGEMTL